MDRIWRHALILGCFLTCPLVSHAEDSSTPFQVSLFHPVQLFPDNYSVDGFDLGIFNDVKKDFKGFQLGVIANITRRSCEGVQVAVFYNDAQEELQGLQIGLVNHTGSLAGVQIGLLNFNDDTKYLGFFPFINAAF